MLFPVEDHTFAPLEILTERLKLRPIRLADAADMSYLVTPGVSRWTGTFPDEMTAGDAAERIALIERLMEAGDDVTLAIEPRRGQRFVGWIGLRRMKADPRRANLGYWLGESFHGRGWMREAAQAFLPACWDMMDVDVVEAGARPENAPSLAVLHGLGMAPVGERTTYSEVRQRDETCLYFEIRRPLWFGSRRA
jgi:RimJ/RimL family protein N-acetyltransferase